MSFIAVTAKMPKTRTELNKYCRQWRKNTHAKKRFDKGLHIYLETKHKVIYDQYVYFYNSLNEVHPEAKDITKTKTFKTWKKGYQTEPDRNVESPEQTEPDRNVESPEQTEPVRNVESPEQTEPDRNVESPEQTEPDRNVESPEQTEPDRNVESPEQTEPDRNVESPEQTEPVRNVESPEQTEPVRNVDILAEALGEPLHPVENLDIDEMDNIIQEIISLRSRRYSRAQEGKLEIPPAQKLSILSSAHRAHGSAHTSVFALENQSERELLIMLLAGVNFIIVLYFSVMASKTTPTKPLSKHTR